jgi:hypothetical protein
MRTMGAVEYFARRAISDIGDRLKNSIKRTFRELTSMPARKYPLELVLRAHGPVELVNADDEVLWVSETDDDFKEEFSDEFLQEEDIEEILDYLADCEILTVTEFNAFQSNRWDCTVETLETSATVGGADPDEDDENGEDDDEWDDDDEDDE